MSETVDELERLRQEIDAIDERIVAALNQRAEFVVQIGRYKQVTGKAVYAPDREKEVMERIRRLNGGPLADRTIHAIYRELMSGSLTLERAPRIAFLGPKGSFSHQAAVLKFGSSVEHEALGSIRAIFEQVERGQVDLGVVPVENSTGGGVVDTLDELQERSVRAYGEIHLAVHHHLLGRCSLEQVERVYSKPEAFAQCKQWLIETGLSDKTVPAASTSKAAELAAHEERSAAIGSGLAGELFGLARICERIEDDPDNVTRFLVISQRAAGPTGKDKTAVVFSAADRPGALVEVLDVWRQAGINMSFIESRPSRREKRNYSFYVDVAGHAEQEPLQSAIETAKQHCTVFRVIGSFPESGEVVQ